MKKTILGASVGALFVYLTTAAPAQALPPQCYQNLGPAVAAACAKMNPNSPDGNWGTGGPAHNICVITGHDC